MKQLTGDTVDPNLLSDKLIELEYRSQRNNFKYKLNIENLVNIVESHSMVKWKGNRSHTIIFKLTNKRYFLMP